MAGVAATGVALPGSVTVAGVAVTAAPDFSRTHHHAPKNAFDVELKRLRLGQCPKCGNNLWKHGLMGRKLFVPVESKHAQHGICKNPQCPLNVQPENERGDDASEYLADTTVVDGCFEEDTLADVDTTAGILDADAYEEPITDVSMGAIPEEVASLESVLERSRAEAEAITKRYGRSFGQDVPKALAHWKEGQNYEAPTVFDLTLSTIEEIASKDLTQVVRGLERVAILCKEYGDEFKAQFCYLCKYDDSPYGKKDGIDMLLKAVNDRFRDNALVHNRAHLGLLELFQNSKSSVEAFRAKGWYETDNSFLKRGLDKFVSYKDDIDQIRQICRYE